MHQKFSLLHLNIRSISNKFDSLKNLINTIGLTETWLNENNKDCFTMNNYEYFGFNRLEKRGGGVCLYVSKELEYKIRNDLTKNIGDMIETKFIEIVNNNGKNIIVGAIYRPPNSYFATF